MQPILLSQTSSGSKSLGPGAEPLNFTRSQTVGYHTQGKLLHERWKGWEKLGEGGGFNTSGCRLIFTAIFPITFSTHSQTSSPDELIHTPLVGIIHCQSKLQASSYLYLDLSREFSLFPLALSPYHQLNCHSLRSCADLITQTVKLCSETFTDCHCRLQSHPGLNGALNSFSKELLVYSECLV